MNQIGFKSGAHQAAAGPCTPEQEFAAMLRATTNFDVAYNTGMAASRNKKFDLAAMALERAAELNPAPFVLTALAAVCRKLGNLEAAENLYQHVLSAGPHPAAMVGLAALYCDQGQHHQARGLYDQVLAADPANFFALRGLVRVYIKLNQPDAAKAYHARIQAHDSPLRAQCTATGCLGQLSQIKQNYADRKDIQAVRRVSALITWVSGEAA